MVWLWVLLKDPPLLISICALWKRIFLPNALLTLNLYFTACMSMILFEYLRIMLRFNAFFFLNCQHPNILFIHEIEDRRSLPVLDVLVTHSDNGFLLISFARKRLLGYMLTLIACHLPNIKVNLIFFVFIVLVIIVPHIFPFMKKCVVLGIFSISFCFLFIRLIE